MKNLPNKVYLQVDAQDSPTPEDRFDWDFEELQGVTWDKEPIGDSDIEYVRQDIANRWISVEERMPPVGNGSVLAWFVGPEKSIASEREEFCITANYENSEDYWICHYNEARYKWKITHWKFLPSKPM